MKKTIISHKTNFNIFNPPLWKDKNAVKSVSTILSKFNDYQNPYNIPRNAKFSLVT